MSEVLCRCWSHGCEESAQEGPQTHRQSHWRSADYTCFCLPLRLDSVFNFDEQCFHSSLTATVCSSLSNLEGEETFEAAMLGQAEEVVQDRVCDDELILVKK